MCNLLQNAVWHIGRDPHPSREDQSVEQRRRTISCVRSGSHGESSRSLSDNVGVGTGQTCPSHMRSTMRCWTGLRRFPTCSLHGCCWCIARLREQIAFPGWLEPEAAEYFCRRHDPDQPQDVMDTATMLLALGGLGLSAMIACP